MRRSRRSESKRTHSISRGLARMASVIGWRRERSISPRPSLPSLPAAPESERGFTSRTGRYEQHHGGRGDALSPSRKAEPVRARPAHVHAVGRHLEKLRDLGPHGFAMRRDLRSLGDDDGVHVPDGKSAPPRHVADAGEQPPLSAPSRARPCPGKTRRGKRARRRRGSRRRSREGAASPSECPFSPAGCGTSIPPRRRGRPPRTGARRSRSRRGRCSSVCPHLFIRSARIASASSRSSGVVTLKPSLEIGAIATGMPRRSQSAASSVASSSERENPAQDLLAKRLRRGGRPQARAVDRGRDPASLDLLHRVDDRRRGDRGAVFFRRPHASGRFRRGDQRPRGVMDADDVLRRGSERRESAPDRFGPRRASGNGDLAGAEEGSQVRQPFGRPGDHDAPDAAGPEHFERGSEERTAAESHQGLWLAAPEPGAGARGGDDRDPGHRPRAVRRRGSLSLSPSGDRRPR